jgi:hypothetical protein
MDRDPRRCPFLEGVPEVFSRAQRERKIPVILTNGKEL